MSAIADTTRTGPPMNTATRFAAAWAILTAAHDVADHWLQTDEQATTKGRPDLTGAAACTAHCLTYTATQGAALYAANRLLRLELRPSSALAALAISALTHYAADRQGGRWSAPQPAGVARLAAATGHAEWLRRDPHAGYFLDQSWHKGWLAVAALVAARS